jgi:hypothetical protein
MKALGRSAQCHREAVRTFYNSSEGAEVVADAVLGTCILEDSAYERAVDAHIKVNGYNPDDQDFVAIKEANKVEVRQGILASILRLRNASTVTP